MGINNPGPQAIREDGINNCGELHLGSGFIQKHPKPFSIVKLSFLRYWVLIKDAVLERNFKIIDLRNVITLQGIVVM